MNDLKDTPEETDSTSSIICPWCMHAHRALTDYFEDGICSCESCGKDFELRIVTDVTYYAKPVMEEKP